MTHIHPVANDRSRPKCAVAAALAVVSLLALPLDRNASADALHGQVESVSASDDWVGRLNYWRSFGGGLNGEAMPLLNHDQSMDLPPQNHDDYLAALASSGHPYCGHGSAPGFPEPPNVQSFENVLYCGVASVSDAVDGWMQMPYHGVFLADPYAQRAGAGFASGYASLYFDQTGAATAQTYTWPKAGGTLPFLVADAAHEIPDPRLACPSEPTQQAGAAIFVSPVPLPSGRYRQFQSVDIVDTTTGLHLGACVFGLFTAFNTPDVYLTQTVPIFPKQSWAAGHNYLVTLTNRVFDSGPTNQSTAVGGSPETISWTFSVSPGSPPGEQMESGPVRAGYSVVAHASGPGEVVMGTVTVDRSSGPGFVTVYPCADGRPNASNVNFVAGQAVANSFIATADASGDLCAYTSAATDVIVDVVGATTSIDGLHNAQRLVDTRIGNHLTAWAGS